MPMQHCYTEFGKCSVLKVVLSLSHTDIYLWMSCCPRHWLTAHQCYVWCHEATAVCNQYVTNLSTLWRLWKLVKHQLFTAWSMHVLKDLLCALLVILN